MRRLQVYELFRVIARKLGRLQYSEYIARRYIVNPHFHYAENSMQRKFLWTIILYHAQDDNVDALKPCSECNIVNRERLIEPSRVYRALQYLIWIDETGALSMIQEHPYCIEPLLLFFSFFYTGYGYVSHRYTRGAL